MCVAYTDSMTTTNNDTPRTLALRFRRNWLTQALASRPCYDMETRADFEARQGADAARARRELAVIEALPETASRDDVLAAVRLAAVG